MFSKEWLEQCSQSITSYETPAKTDGMKSFRPGYSEDEDFGIIDDDMEEVVKNKTSTDKKDWKKMLLKMKKRRGE